MGDNESEYLGDSIDLTGDLLSEVEGVSSAVPDEALNSKVADFCANSSDFFSVMYLS